MASNGVAVARGARIFDQDAVNDFIRSRQERGLDARDEVWEGVYVVPPLANNPHQSLVGRLCALFFQVFGLDGGAQVFPGANVSDRRKNWEHNYRCPDVVVVLPGGRAVDCGTHWMGGPDFLIEVQSPGDETDDKLPFYASLHIRELLVIGRETRELTLYRHDGTSLVAVGPSPYQGKKWLVSEVIPFAFRRRAARGTPMTELSRTDDTPGNWVI